MTKRVAGVEPYYLPSEVPPAHDIQGGADSGRRDLDTPPLTPKDSPGDTPRLRPPESYPQHFIGGPKCNR